MDKLRLISMRRPRSSLGNPLLVGACAALVVLGCGKGLFTRAALVQVQDANTGGVIDPGTGSGTGGAGAGGTASQTGGTGASTSPDASAPADSQSTLPDASPRFDVGVGTSKTQDVSAGSNATISCGGATLSILKDSIPPGGPYPVTLTLVSDDGTLSLPNGEGTQEYGGAIGPIYSISVGFVIWEKATLSIHVVPDPSITRVGLAYVDQPSRIWVKASNSHYDPATNLVTGTVSNPTGVLYFAPVEFCTIEGQDGGTCHLPNLRCKGEACQE